MYSEHSSRHEGVDWFRAISAEDICYYHNAHPRPPAFAFPPDDSPWAPEIITKLPNPARSGRGGYDECYYTLTFTLRFPHSFDTVRCLLVTARTAWRLRRKTSVLSCFFFVLLAFACSCPGSWRVLTCPMHDMTCPVHDMTCPVHDMTCPVRDVTCSVPSRDVSCA